MPIRTALSLLRAAFIAALTATVLPMTLHAAAGDPPGPDFRVDSGTGTGVLSPAMGRDSIGNGVVVWERLGSSAPGIHERGCGADGSSQGLEAAVPLPEGISTEGTHAQLKS